MLFNTYVFQVGLVSLLLKRFRAMLVYCALYLTLSIILHSWIMVVVCPPCTPVRNWVQICIIR